MKNLVILLTFILCLTFSSNSAQAQMPPKAKAFLQVAAYGAGSGALIGFSSMAFGASTRAIAQGASLGLYAGMIFGAYVIFSHERPNTYNDYDYDPYNPNIPIDPYSPRGYDRMPDPQSQPPPQEKGFFDSSVLRIDELSQKISIYSNQRKVHDLPLYLNLINVNF